MLLYQLMKKTDHFVWSQRADDAFNDLKQALSTTPILATPAPREPMLLYIAATPRVISIVIVVECTEEGKELPVQRPVYYLSEVLTLSKQNYPHYQKVTYGVYMAAGTGAPNHGGEHHSALEDHRVQGRVRKSGQMGD
jgi:hypothetical protein